MKALLYGLLFFSFVGCSQTGSGDTTTAVQNDPATETSTTTAAMTDSTASGTETAATATTTQEKPMSNYENKIAELHTTAGQINVRFFPDAAPNHVRNFIELSESGFYNNTKFHRVIPGFMIQGGDPNTKAGDPMTWGTGGSPNKLKAEFNSIPHKRGILSMARSGHPDSASSQFFICVADAPSLDRQYSVFGEVTQGMDVVDKIVNAPTGPGDRPNNPVAITSVVVRDAREDEKKKP